MISNFKQDNKLNLFIRIFPSTEFDRDCIKFDDCRKCIYVRCSHEFHSFPSKRTLPNYFCYKTDGIFLNSCQSEVYETIVNGLINHIYLGIDSVILSYGQNYSGKTFTTTGLHNQFELRGIVPRFITDLFTEDLKKQKNFATQIWMSIVDIQNNCVYDLLNNQNKLHKALTKVKSVIIQSELQSLELLFKAEAQRMIIFGKTYNSHSGTNVITFTVKIASINNQEGKVKSGVVHFVDLAGVETIQRNPSTSFKNKEIQGQANLSKTLLEIFALRTQKCRALQLNKYVSSPRSNILIQYLGRSLSFASSIKLICHIRPNHEDLMMALSLLKFGTVFKGMPKVEPKEYLKLNHERSLMNNQDKLRRLEDEILTREFWAKHSSMTITQGRLDFIKRRVKSYIKGDLNELDLLSSVDDCDLILSIMKDNCTAKQSINVISTALQTDDIDSITRGKSDGYKLESQAEETTLIKSIIKDNTESVLSDKHVSFLNYKPTEKSKLSPKGKTKNVKKKTEARPALVSKEVQVNLIEPLSKMPCIKSREAAWAMFIISKPDFEVKIIKLNSIVLDSENKLTKQEIRVDHINNALNKKEIELQRLSTMRNFVDHDVYEDQTFNITEKETKLVKELNSLKNESVIHQQKLIEAQTDWLEALEKLKYEKETIEKEFKDFCKSNNLLILRTEIPLLEEVETKQSVIITQSLQCNAEQKKYTKLQRQYLH